MKHFFSDQNTEDIEENSDDDPITNLSIMTIEELKEVKETLDLYAE